MRENKLTGLLGFTLLGFCALAIWALGTSGVAAQDDDPAANNTLVIRITGAESDRGRIGCALFWKNKGFPWKYRRGLRRTWTEIAGDSAECVFKRTGLGEYAVSVFHDENDNGEFNTTLGLPAEGWGVSNNVRARRVGRPPKYKDALFKYEGGPLELEIQLIY
mgnify:CR=1 FL=1